MYRFRLRSSLPAGLIPTPQLFFLTQNLGCRTGTKRADDSGGGSFGSAECDQYDARACRLRTSGSGGLGRPATFWLRAQNWWPFLSSRLIWFFLLSDSRVWVKRIMDYMYWKCCFCWRNAEDFLHRIWGVVPYICFKRQAIWGNGDHCNSFLGSVILVSIIFVHLCVFYSKLFI